MTLEQWAIRWGVSHAALAELKAQLGVATDPDARHAGESEAAVQNRVRLEASRKGLRLFRNNVGACTDDKGRHIRYGLANDSAKLNREVKSADLIGFRPVLIEQHHVGSVIGQFVSRECKPEGWSYAGTEHETAQLRWAELCAAFGCDAAFTTGEGSL